MESTAAESTGTAAAEVTPAETGMAARAIQAGGAAVAKPAECAAAPGSSRAITASETTACREVLLSSVESTGLGGRF